MKWLSSFFILSLILFSTSVSASANSEVEPIAELSCIHSSSGLHEMKGDGPAFVRHTNGGTLLSNAQAWKCRACGHGLITEGASWATSFGKYITDYDYKHAGGYNYTTSKSLGQMSSTNNRVIKGYQFL